MTPAAGEGDGIYKMPRAKWSAEGKKGASWKHARSPAGSPSEGWKCTRVEPGPSEEGVWTTVEEGQETPEEHLKTRRTLTLLSITTGLGEIRSEEETSPSTLKKPELDISNTSSTSVEESDPFQRLLHALKNSPRSTKQPQIEEMSEDKRPSGSRPKVEPTAEEAVIGTTVLVQVVAAEKEVKVALPRAFTRHQKDVKKFLREVQLYIALNSRAFTMDQAKKIFFLFYMTDGPGEFWKNNKTDLLLAFDPEAEKVL
uniref:Uncharacterized protein n=1 Tax=Moniliophthora roreri TaxID=221103 RepID=A0A0W0G0A4_MONRR